MDSFCRTCMCQVIGNTEGNIESFNIFKTKDLAQMLIHCTNLQIVPYDEYPPLVCAKCFANVLSFYEFQQMCRYSLDKFTKMLENKSEVETESVLEKSADRDITECKGFLVKQLEGKCRNYDLAELIDQDPLLMTTNSLLEVEEPSSSWICNELRNRVLKKSTSEVKEGDMYSQSKKEKDESREAKSKLAKKAEEKAKFGLKIKPEDENDGSEDMSGNSSDSELTLSGSDSAFPDLKPKTYSGIGFESHMQRYQGRRYSCTRDNCGRTFSRLSYLKQHINNHDGIKRTIYKCDWDNCQQSYMCKSGLRVHKRKCHSGKPIETEIHMCEKCGAVLRSSRSLRDHHFIHIDKAEWPFVCDVDGCSKRFRISDQLKIHKKRHAGIKNYACPHCDMRFVTKSNMMNHVKHHTWEKRLSCKFCPEVCNTPAALQAHTQNEHGQKSVIDPSCDIKQTSRFECSFCDSAFFTVEGKKYHEMIHTGEKPYVCNECGKKFRQPAGLKLHMRTHMNDAHRSYVCSTCGRAFFTSHTLRHHEMKHTGEKPYKCAECGLSYRWPTNLIIHQRQHKRETHNESKEEAIAQSRTWSCEHCTKVCNTLVNMQRHIKNKHSGSTREFKCSFCNATFGTIEVKRSHEKRHTSDKPHVCEKCGMRFIWAYLLRVHQKKHVKTTSEVTEKQ